MPTLLRSSAPRGARFYIDGDVIMFHHVIDACTYHGPRPALTEDMEAHPEAWATFEAGDEPLPPGSAPLITFKTLEGTKIPEAAKAKGSKAPA